MPKFPPVKLSELVIDVDKDMDGHTLTDIRKAIAAGEPLSVEQMLAVVAYAWTGGIGEDNCLALTQDTDYVYAGLETAPALVIKIAKATMTTSAAWTGGIGENLCFALTQDTDYVYAGLVTTPALLFKIPSQHLRALFSQA